MALSRPQSLSDYAARASLLEPVVCPVCEHANPAGARYCNQCAAPVHLRECPYCEAINDGDATRCYKCSAPLPGPNPGLLGSGLEAAPRVWQPPEDAAAAQPSKPGSAPSVTDGTPAAHVPPALDTPVPTIPPPDAPLPPATGDASALAAVPASEEAPRHFVGELTAPVDEAELSEPDIESTRSHRHRRGWMLLTAVVLLVPPATVAAWFFHEHPEALDRGIASARAFLDGQHAWQTVPQAAPQTVPQAAPQAGPQGAPQAMPQAAPQAGPQGAPQAVPQGAPQAVPRGAPQAMPQGAPQATPQAAPQATPQAAPQATPQAAPQAARQAVPASTVDTRADGEPSGASDAHPMPLSPGTAAGAGQATQ